MARPKQDGLLYFSFDTDFFYADQRIKRLHSRYGSDGMLFFIYLLTEIYRNGYYIRWDGESVDNAMDDLHLSEGLIEQVMTFLISRSLLTKRTLANSDTIITSPGIQKRYQEAVKSRKRDVCVDPEIWLLGENETAAYIKAADNGNKSCGNGNKSCGNESKSCGNDIKKSKVKESKENKRETVAANRFEDFWNEYPKKQRRYLAENAYCELIRTGKAVEDVLVEAARNYARSCAAMETDTVHIKNADNFLKEFVFEDYLPGKYQETDKKRGNKDNPKESTAEEEELAGDDWMNYGAYDWDREGIWD